jgi:hypothetical protein
MISHENLLLQKSIMGVETPIPPMVMNTAAPDGAPPRRGFRSSQPGVMQEEAPVSREKYFLNQKKIR